MHHEYRHYRLSQIREQSESQISASGCSLRSLNHSGDTSLKRGSKASIQSQDLEHLSTPSGVTASESARGHLLLDLRSTAPTIRQNSSHTKSYRTYMLEFASSDIPRNLIQNTLPMIEEQQVHRVSAVPDLAESEQRSQVKTPHQGAKKWTTFGLFRPSLITAQSSDVAASAHVDEPSVQQSLALRSLARFDIGQPAPQPTDVQASDPEPTSQAEDPQNTISQESFTLSPDSDATSVPLPASGDISEEQAEAAEETELAVNPKASPPVELESQSAAEEAFESGTPPTVEKDKLAEETTQTTNLVPAIHIHAPSSAVGLPAKLDDKSAGMATGLPELPLASPTTLDLNSVRALSPPEEPLSSQNFTLPQPLALGTNPLTDTDLVPSSLPATGHLPNIPPTLPVPEIPLIKPSKRRRLVQRARKLILRKRILVLLLGRELADVTHDQVNLSQNITQSAPIPGLDGSAPSSSIRYVRRPVYRANPRLMSPELSAQGARITWQSSAAPSVQSTPRIRPQRSNRGPSPTQVQQLTHPDRSIQTQSQLRPQQNAQARTPHRLQQNVQDDAPRRAMSRQERQATKEERKRLKRVNTLRNKEDKRQRKRAKHQQKYRAQAEKLRKSISVDLKQRGQELDKLPKCSACGKRSPSRRLTKYLSIRQRANQLDSILQRDKIPKTLLTAVDGSMTMQDAAALRRQYQCACAEHEVMQPGPSHAPPVAVANCVPLPSSIDCQVDCGGGQDCGTSS